MWFLAFLYIFLLSLSFLGYGKFFELFFLKEKRTQCVGQIGLLGLFFVSIIITFIHFFFKISIFLFFLTHIVGIIFFLLFFEKKKIFLKKKFIIFNFFFIFSSLLMLAYHKPNEDFGYYHLPYLINITQEKIIFGLVNIQFNQGWNSIWLNIASSLNLPLLGSNGFHLLNILFLIFFCNIFLNLIEEKNLNFFSNLSIFFFLIFGAYLIIKFLILNIFGFDVPANFITIFVYYLFIKFFSINKNFNSEKIKIFKKILIFSSFAFMIKLSTAPIVLLPIFIVLIYFLNKSLKKIFLFIIIISFFFSIWCIQQFIYTGCFLFPLKISCFEVFWFNNIAIIDLVKNTPIINKSFFTYAGNLTPDEYIKNFNWVKNWFLRAKIELFEHIIIFSVIFFTVFFFNFSKNKKFFLNVKKINRSFFFFIFFSNLIFILFWFNLSPVPRFGVHHLLILFFFISCVIFNHLLNKKILPITIFLFLIFSILLNVSKNIQRVFAEEQSNKNFFFPKYPEQKYLNFFDQKQNININILTGTSIMCWNVPSICVPHQNFSVKKKLGYIVFNYEKK